MALTRLLIANFRNIRAADLTLSQRFNGLLGANGSGKTSLLEAIYVLGHGRSFRQKCSSHLVSHEQMGCSLHGCIEHETTQQRIGVYKSRQGRDRIRIAGEEGRKYAELAQLLPIQLFTPDSLDLLTDGPKGRCAFIDWGCFHHHPAFLAVWNRVRRLLQQRNAALKQARHYQALKAWDHALAPLAEQLSHWRSTYSTALFATATATCMQLLPEYQFTFSFHPGWPPEADYLQLLAQQFLQDRAATYTRLGPHRTDLQIRADGVPVTACLSRGQLKLLVYALKLAQGRYFTQQTGRDCLYLLDDFMTELDGEHCQSLILCLKQITGQLIASGLERRQLADLINEKDKLFLLDRGKITTQ